jgi:DNA-binding XRE family transcriptional regulator
LLVFFFDGIQQETKLNEKAEKMKKPRKNREGEAGGEARKELQAFAVRLRQARENAGLTQQQVAMAIGLANYVSYQYWERAKRWPSAEYLAMLCRTLGVSSDELLGIRVDSNEEDTTAHPQEITE